MTQNIYDAPGFFAGYSALCRSVQGLDGAPEWPALRAMLPPLAGRRVVDLGCGFGWFCRWAAGQGGGMLGTTQNLLLAAGFAIARIEEFAPTETQVAADPALAEERERPMFLLVAARR
jgi:SAM-dependent methyltransferase